jgi:hypothetical protein
LNSIYIGSSPRIPYFGDTTDSRSLRPSIVSLLILRYHDPPPTSPPLKFIPPPQPSDSHALPPPTLPPHRPILDPPLPLALPFSSPRREPSHYSLSQFDLHDPKSHHRPSLSQLCARGRDRRRTYAACIRSGYYGRKGGRSRRRYLGGGYREESAGAQGEYRGASPRQGCSSVSHIPSRRRVGTD